MMQRNERKILTVSENCLVFGGELSGFKLYCRLLMVIIGKIASETKKEEEEEEGSSGLKLYLLLLHSFKAAWTGSPPPMLPQPCIDHCKLSSSQSCDNSVVTNHSGTFRKLSSNHHPTTTDIQIKQDLSILRTSADIVSSSVFNVLC